jgi:hypothetical protein
LTISGRPTPGCGTTRTRKPRLLAGEWGKWHALAAAVMHFLHTDAEGLCMLIMLEAQHTP